MTWLPGGPNPKAAASLLNFLLGQEAQTCYVEAVNYGTVRDDVDIPGDTSLYVPHGSDVSQYFPIDWGCPRHPVQHAG